MYAYNFSKNEWREVESKGITKPSARFGHTLTRLNEYFKVPAIICRNIYLFGGAAGTTYFNDLFKYNTFTKKWELIEAKGKPPKPRYKHETILTRQGNLFIFGGISGEERFVDAFEFNTENKTWTIVPLVESTLYKGRYGFTANVYDNHVLVFGGSDEKKLSSILRLSMKSKRWERMKVDSSPPEPRDFHTACIYSNKLVIFGGATNQTKTNEVFEYGLPKSIPPCSLKLDFGKLLEMTKAYHEPCDLVIRVLNSENEVKAKYYSYFPLFKTRIPSLATPYETFTEDGKTFKGVSFKCSKEVIELLLEYIYTDTIDFERWGINDIFDCVALCISYGSTRPAVALIRYLAGGIKRTNACLIAEKSYEMTLFAGNLHSDAKELKEACQNLYMVSLKFLVGFWDLMNTRTDFKNLSPAILQEARTYHEKQTKIDKDVQHLQQRSPAFKKPKSSQISSEAIVIKSGSFPKPKEDAYYEDMRKLYQDNEGKDYTLTLKTYKTKAHKFILVYILMARSGYFRKMFDIGMQESSKPEASINAILEDKAALFERFLSYLYTGDVGLGDIKVEQMVDLMQWADFYAVHSERLEYLCVERIGEKLPALTPLQLQNVLKTAEHLNLQTLIEKIIRHLAKRMPILFHMDELRTFSPDILADILLERAKLDNNDKSI